MEDYDKSNKEHRRFLASQKDRSETPLVQKLLIGGAAAVGASALAYRSGGMHRAAQWLSKEGNALSRAYKETRSEQGRLSKNLNKDSFRNTKDSFLKKRKEHLDLHN